MSVNEKMTLLADAVRSKSGTTGPLSIDGMTTAVNSITVGSGIDTSDATAYAARILAPYTAYARGQKITGTMSSNGALQKELTPLNHWVTGNSGYYSSVSVQVDISVSRTFTPSKERQVFDGYNEGKFLTNVTVEPIPDEYITTSDATATASDISAGKTAYVKGELVTGTLEDVTAVIDGATVTIPAGRIRKEQTVTIPAGSISIDGGTVTITAGYVEEGTLSLELSSGLSVSGATVTAGKGYLEEDLTVEIPMGQLSVYDNGSGWRLGEGYYNETTLEVPSGSITISGNTVTISAGYLERKELTIPAGSVTIDTTVNKVIVSEGYVQSEELDVPGGFQLVKVTNYHPAREGMSEPETVTFSGLGTVESQYGGDPVDFSDVNGDYVVTEETKFKKGLARVYKQQDGKYYLCGYDPSGMDWAEYSAHWYVSETVGGYGYSAKMSLYSSSEIHPGTVNWSNDNIGEFPVTTTVAMRDYPALTETSLAQSVTAFDPETAEWTEGDSVDISSYSITPQTNGIYFAQDGKLIGQPIDRELHIPQEGLVRRFKAVDGHFVDTVWGTEMLPHGDISYDELGYCGNSAAPMAVKSGSYLSANNTLGTMYVLTMNSFVKPYYGDARIFSFDNGDDNYLGFTTTVFRTLPAVAGNGVSAGSLSFGKWNMQTLTLYQNENNKNEFSVRYYINGKFVAEMTRENLLADPGTLMGGSLIKVGYGGNFIGQIDEACIWDRILTDEEIAAMATGLEGFNWDIPVKPYVQEQPVLYLSGANRRYAESGQLLSGADESGGEFRDGAIYSYSGDTVYPGMYIPASAELFGSEDFSLCLEVMPIIARNSAVACPVINSGSNYPGFFLKQIDGEGEYHPGYYAGTELVCTSESVPLSEWTYIIITCEKGTLRMYKNGILCMSQSTTGSHIPIASNKFRLFREAGYSYGFKGAVRNIRLYNRAITDEEVAELSGVKETE